MMAGNIGWVIFIKIISILSISISISKRESIICLILSPTNSDKNGSCTLVIVVPNRFELWYIPTPERFCFNLHPSKIPTQCLLLSYALLPIKVHHWSFMENMPHPNCDGSFSHERVFLCGSWFVSQWALGHHHIPIIKWFFRASWGWAAAAASIQTDRWWFFRLPTFTWTRGL